MRVKTRETFLGRDVPASLYRTARVNKSFIDLNHQRGKSVAKAHNRTGPTKTSPKPKIKVTTLDLKLLAKSICCASQ